jgi:hypothetical protein
MAAMTSRENALYQSGMIHFVSSSCMRIQVTQKFTLVSKPGTDECENVMPWFLFKMAATTVNEYKISSNSLNY